MDAKQNSIESADFDDELEKALKNVRWAIEANSANKTQKTNNHLYRIRELIEHHVEHAHQD